MFRITKLREALVDYSVSFDPTLISAGDAERVLADVAAIKKAAGTVEALCGARIAKGYSSKLGGGSTAAAHMAQVTGTSEKQARDAIELGNNLALLDATGKAARAGEISLDQARIIADAAKADPSSEAKLLAKSKTSSFRELREESGRHIAAVVDMEQRRKEIHRTRHLRTYTDPDGSWNLHYWGNPESGAQIMGTLQPIANGFFRKARAEGRREPAEAYLADALEDVCANKAAGSLKGGGPQHKIIWRIDLPAWLRGYPKDDEVCEIAGFGPVAVSAAKDMVASGNPILSAVVTKGKDVTTVTHVRRPNVHQQSALQWMYPQCAVEGCSASVRLQDDHRIDWAKTQITVLEHLDKLCRSHHRQKTTQNWQLVDGVGKRAFVPPGDARYPKRAGLGFRRANAPPDTS